MRSPEAVFKQTRAFLSRRERQRVKQYWNDFDRKHSSSSRGTHARTHIEGENESKRDRDLFGYMLSNPTERKSGCTKQYISPEWKTPLEQSSTLTGKKKRKN